MENTDKLRVLLQHWIDHNIGHAEEFEKWQQIAADEKQEEIATQIAEAINSMKAANEALSKALKAAGGAPSEEGGHHHHHHHHHDHDH